MSETKHSRKTDIIFLNILFCFLVIFIHVSSEIVNYMPRDTKTFRLVFAAQKLSTFVVPGFLLLSGAKLFMHKKDNINYAKFYITRIYRVLLPYILWSVVYFFFRNYLENKSFDIRDFISGLITGKIWAHFYFVVVLIQFDLLVPLWMLLYKRGLSSVHIFYAFGLTVASSLFLPSILTTVFPWMPDIDFTRLFLSYQIYWTAGCMIGKNFDEFRTYLKTNKVFITINFIVFAFIEVYLSQTNLGHEPIWMELFHILYTSSAICFFFMLAQIFNGKAKAILKLFSTVDRSSYMVYLIHCLIIALVDFWLNYQNITSLKTRFLIRTAGVYLIVIGICFVWSLFKMLISRRRKD